MSLRHLLIDELLGLCEEFFRQAGPFAHSELSQFLTEHGHPPACQGSSTPMASTHSRPQRAGRLTPAAHDSERACPG